MMDWNVIILSKIKKLLGTAKDTNGSTTAGTLMTKANAILTKINTISTYTNRIGATADTGRSTTAGTLMGKCNTLLSNLGTLTTNLNTVSTKVNSIQTSINSSSSSSVIKSIQRGVISHSGIAKVNISSVDINKSVILYNSNSSVSGTNTVICGAVATFASNTQLTICAKYWEGGSVSQYIAWQVIEFY